MTSDLDNLIDVPRGTTLPDLVGVERWLAQALGVKVDLMTPGDLHPRFRDHVLRQAQTV